VEVEGYEDLVEIGRGGFGVVYRARQRGLDRNVAIKVLATDLDETARRRFDREGRILGLLSEHPNIVTVHDSGTTADGRPWVAMAYLTGGSLADRLLAQGPMGAQEIAEVGVKIAGALETAHRAEILHRDVKPENLLLTSYGEPALADFGIARVAAGTRTVAGSVTASLAHAAPEVLDGSPPTAAVDVYALASTLFTLANGKPAFDPGPDGGVSQMIASIMSRPVPDARTLGLPDAFAAVIEAGLAKDPQDRPATALEFATLLVSAQAEQGWSTTAPVVLDVVAGSADAASVTGNGDDATRVHVVSARQSNHDTSRSPAPSTPLEQTSTAHQPEPDAALHAEAGGDDQSPSGSRRRLAMILGGVAVVAMVTIAAVSLTGGNDDDGEVPDESGDGQPTLADGTLLFPDGPNSGAGRLLFHTTLRDGPALVGTTDSLLVYVVTSERVLGLDLDTGAERWSVARETPGEQDDIGLAVAEGLVIVHDGGGIRALASTSGSEAWTYGRGDTNVQPVTTQSGYVYAVGGGVVVALDPANGQLLWEHPTTSVPWLLPETYPGDAAMVIADGSLTALDANSGDVQWTTDLPSQPVAAAETSNGALVVASVADSALTLTSIELEGGGVIWTSNFAGIDPNAIRLVAEDSVAILADGLTLRGIDGGTGDPMWTLPLEINEPTVRSESGIVFAIGEPGPTLLQAEIYGGTQSCTGPAWYPEWPITGGGRWLLADIDGTIRGLDFDTCGNAWEYDLPDDANAIGPLIVATDYGTAYVIDDAWAVTGLRLWDE